VPPLDAPLAPATAARLRRAVLSLRAVERRRVFGPVLHVGEPGGCEVPFAVRPAQPMEHALRADVVAALLPRLAASPERPPLVWLTRPGELCLQDVDAAWLAAARTAFAEAGLPLTMVVVTRQGWWDPRSGLRREWKRLRG
jgi:hypothetical protein